MDRNVIVSPQENGVIAMRKNFLKLLTRLIDFAYAGICDSGILLLREELYQGANVFGSNKIIVVKKKDEFSLSVI
jgi:hypothetical protein